MIKKTTKTESWIPWFISYPRCGSHWIQAMMEIYLDQSRGPRQNVTWRTLKTGESYAFYQNHDKRLDVKPSYSKEGDVLLYRNPIDVAFSITKSPYRHAGNIEYHTRQYKKLLIKWVPLVTTLLRYEDDPVNNLKKVSKHFNKPWSSHRASKAISIVTKPAVVEKGGVYHPKQLLKKEYADQREEFREVHGKKIMNIMLIDSPECVYSLFFGNNKNEK